MAAAEMVIGRFPWSAKLCGSAVLRQFGVAVLQCCGHAVKQTIKS
jgi:hypothetical protein